MGAHVMSFLYLLQSLQAAGLEAVATSVGENRRLKPGVPGSKSVMLSGKFWASKVRSYQLIGDSRLYQDVEKGKKLWFRIVLSICFHPDLCHGRCACMAGHYD
ncbi:unnamed protein product [Coffea canephora]|uniref:Uncharacterized protein n=1 Tax=Coffea canephora TaxID=49390 RepID=A0A068U0I5_COFCA|nr:unnamed protein product [Coffea canephora]